MGSRNTAINADHEFSPPKIFNSHSNSSTSRTTEIESLCDLNEAEKPQKLQEAPSNSIGFMDTFKNLNMEPKKQSERYKSETRKVRITSQINKKMPKIRNSKEIEKEQQEKAPRFKARPLNKKILESKGELGLQCNKKRQVTIPQEFHFAIDKRIPPRTTTNGAELFEKIALCLKSHNKKLIPRTTIPRPFQFQTEKSGAQKEGKFVHKNIKEGRARIPIPVSKGNKRIIV